MLAPHPDLPLFGEQKCPNCGTMALAESATCLRCGMSLNGPSKMVYGCAILLFQGFLGLLAFGFWGLAMGFMLFGLSLGPAISPGNSDFWIPGVPLLILAALCVWGVVRIGQRQR